MRWARTTSFTTIGKRTLHPLDKALRRTGVPPSSIGTGLPTVFLTTIGRHSGKEHVVPVFAVDVPSGLALIASNWGQQHRPAWFFNLQADPHCRIQRGRKERPYRARPATPAERDQVWRRALEIWPPWQNYAERAGRDLDFFILDPTSTED